MLAAVSPYGYPHSGIERTSGNGSNYSDGDPIVDIDASNDAWEAEYVEAAFDNVEVPFPDSVSIKRSLEGGSEAWPRGDYLNIWVGNLKRNWGSGTPPWLDYYFPQFSGVIVDRGAILEGEYGDYETPEGINLGRHTLAHQIGHWLGLYDTYRHGCYSDCDYQKGDLCKDTPRDKYPAKPTFSEFLILTCGGNECVDEDIDYVDMDENLMDVQSCHRMFTKEQAQRMRCQASTRGPNFLGSGGCVAQLSNPMVNITGGSRILCSGSSRTLAAASYSDVNYSWSIDPVGISGLSITTGSPTAILTNSNPTYSGEITVKLQMYSSICGTSVHEYKFWVGRPKVPIIATANIPFTVGGSTNKPCKNTGFVFVTNASDASEVYEWKIIRTTTGTSTSVVGSWLLPVSSLEYEQYHVVARGVNDCGISYYSNSLQIQVVPCTIFGFPGGRIAALAPNPAHNQVSVKLLDEIAISPNGLQIRVLDVLGTERLSLQSQSRDTQLDISSLSPGIYMVHIHNGEQTDIMRLAVE